MSRFNVFDIEADGLTPTKIHCLSSNQQPTVVDDNDIRNFFDSTDILVGHNIIRWDIPNTERVLGVLISNKVVDTLAMSWCLYPGRFQHGLEEWGEYFGIPKPPIVDWETLPLEDYIHRCEQDVLINAKLWDKVWKLLNKLYGSEEEALRFCLYITEKMQCAAEQERSGWKLDFWATVNHYFTWKDEHIRKTELLAAAMPQVEDVREKTYPKKPYLKSGGLSAIGVKWREFLLEHNLPPEHKEPVKYVHGYDPPNPGSHQQIKAWLYSLGWQPETFKYDRNKETGDVRKIEQVSLPNGAGLCPSVKRLYRKEPQLELLDGLAILAHRITIVKGFIANVDDNGCVQARVSGLTNTLRFKHAVCVNLPGVDKAYGKEIRGCLVAPDGYELCGSDMSSLEDRTKQHYMRKHDPEYVLQMQEEGFDPHLDLAIQAGMLTKSQSDAHKAGTEDFSAQRKAGKGGNYSCLYGAGAPTVARSTGMPLKQAKIVVEAYAKRNWAVQAIAAECVVKVVDKRKWLFNPVSGFWYSLRHEKDRFSTLNQGTGVYCFDTWVKHIRRKRKQMTAQFHDEVVLCIKKGFRDKATKLLRWAIEETNKELNLNVKLDVDIQFDSNYAGIH